MRFEIDTYFWWRYPIPALIFSGSVRTWKWLCFLLEVR